jgi:hypothetical protein
LRILLKCQGTSARIKKYKGRTDERYKEGQMNGPTGGYEDGTNEMTTKNNITVWLTIQY